jgi:hypothetical protein
METGSMWILGSGVSVDVIRSLRVLTLTGAGATTTPPARKGFEIVWCTC